MVKSSPNLTNEYGEIITKLHQHKIDPNPVIGPDAFSAMGFWLSLFIGLFEKEDLLWYGMASVCL